MAWHGLTGPFKSSHVLICYFSCFQYNIWWLFHRQTCALAQLVSGWRKLPKGLGSNPRSPILFHNFITCMIRYMYRRKDYHIPSSFSHQIAHKLDQKAIIWESTMHLSQANTLDYGGQRGPMLIGLRSAIGTPFLLWHQTHILILFFYIFLYLFYFD